MGKDYYKILGVGKDADDAALKRAYRKLAMKWHPDKNKDNKDEAIKMFQDISEAYEVLSDKDKRTIYDQYGEEGLKGGPMPGGPGGMGDGAGGMGGQSFSFSFGGPGGAGGFSDPFDLFSRMFGGGGGGGGEDMFMGGLGGMGRMGGGGHRGPRKGQTTMVEVRLPLEDLYAGCVKKLKITRKRMAGGNTYREDQKVVEISVKPGWKAGTKITFEGEGDEAPGVAPGDIVFVIQELPHPRFERRGNDLVFKKSISLTEALCGTQFDVQLLNHRSHQISTVGEVIRPGVAKRIAGLGMPISKFQGSRFGDLIVEFDIRFPQRLTPHQMEQVKSLRL